MITLKGHAALVTGSTKGVGRAIAIALAEAGADVVIHGRAMSDEAGETMEQCRRHGVQVAFVAGDLSGPGEAAVNKVFTEATAAHGRIDILVNNAGVVADWDKSYAIHVKALHFCSEAVKDHMAERGSGRIVNITSTCVLTGGTGIPQYVATKAGAYSLTRYQAKTYAPLGILVNAVMPAVIMSDMIMTRYASEEEMQAHYIPQMPVRRIGYPEDVANVVLFLCSDLSSFVNGEIIVADGGRMYVG